jgi:hypothetical protein
VLGHYFGRLLGVFGAVLDPLEDYFVATLGHDLERTTRRARGMRVTRLKARSTGGAAASNRHGGDLRERAFGNAACGSYLKRLRERVGNDAVDGSNADTDAGDRATGCSAFYGVENTLAVTHLMHGALLTSTGSAGSDEGLE